MRTRERQRDPGQHGPDQGVEDADHRRGAERGPAAVEDEAGQHRGEQEQGDRVEQQDQQATAENPKAHAATLRGRVVERPVGSSVRIALAAALWVLVSAAVASADQRTVIGHSVKGRPIVAVPARTPRARLRVLVVGCIHGNETAGIRVARRLIAAAAPPGAALWVVPTLNPDGVAAGTRGNAHGVDLNRNFPFGWQPARRRSNTPGRARSRSPSRGRRAG